VTYDLESRRSVEGRVSEKPWATWVVVAAGVLLVAAGAFIAVSSEHAHAIYNALIAVANHVLTSRPKFLTLDWVERRVWVLRVIAALVIASGVAVIVARRWAGVRAAAATRRSWAWWIGIPRRVRAVPLAEIAALAAIVIAGVVVRAIVLNDPMRYDETYNYAELASQRVAAALSVYLNQNNHVLNTLLTHVSIRHFGSDPWAIRLPAFIAGCLLIPATYFAGRALYSGAAGLLAAGLVAASSPLIEYSANARGYSLAALAFVLLLRLGRALILRANAFAATAFAIVAALGMWAVPTTALALATVVLWAGVEICVRRGGRPSRIAMLVAAVIVAALLTVVLYGPVLLMGGAGLTNNSDYTSDLGSVIGNVARHWTRDMPVVVIALLAVGLVVGLARHRRVTELRVPPIAAAVPVVLVALAAGRLVQYPRTWLFLLPLAFITAGAGVVYAVSQIVGRRRSVPSWLPAATAAAFTGALFIGGATTAIRNQNEGRDAPALTAWLGTTLKTHGGHVVTITPFNYILRYYFPRAGLTTDYVIDAVDPMSAKAHLFVVVPAGKTLGQMTGTQKILKTEGAAFKPVAGLQEAVSGKARLAKQFPTARVYESG
jgi:hypothetical protein